MNSTERCGRTPLLSNAAVKRPARSPVINYMASDLHKHCAPGGIRTPNLLIRSPGGRQSACIAGSLTCGDVSVAVGHGVSKSAPIAVNYCYQDGFRIPGIATTSGAVPETLTAPSSMRPDDTDVRG